MEYLQVFVYGTLKPGEVNYKSYCAEYVVDAFPAITNGLLYELSFGYPAMTRGDMNVYGFILSFTNPDVLLDLDRLEDYHPERHPTENEYQRQKIDTFGINGEYLWTVWSYLMLPEKVNLFGGKLLPSGFWTNH
ncbi:MAG: gamma-glutamylcyclotransferase [Okeania sp. SIO2C2]|uniref:Gamma-glutamylcyclotransferase n=1 Tax=Okeania hirsuta TaxID=1458930 RepID=A0A3N6RGN9_9CYAN|nr:gamma-glutamylcyclotransferase [Okeania sp. SIO2G5]NEP88819.1 gamma-glutamylcyclotransferase [Okeania sp. SIO2C2]NEP95978.1 gamma-glutamylcyclotransferase [Okeania sp. SIO2F5]NEQ92930.1 gamma-glutamylcyclotransferase [Okeania sp. SIO2G4]NES77426.1 gamma-glutamylcyclotransferase [Okeania sp. SIO1H4]NES90585.1 gamma-glutamylcyclotransferase [Okeania sp. SIO2B9]NET12741.1 gamma-glutamylcyclotransferase [Okeania sp. SIO1H6]NET20931.1 gamma-glutamylcyclotransferase [Okeania sp. SIO1H5]NET7776